MFPKIGLLVCLAAAATATAGVAQEPAVAAPSAPTPASPAAAEEPWVSASGSGLLSIADTSTLPRRQLDLSIAFDNQDRDPLRLDVADYSIAWNYGVRSRVETYGHLVVSRAVIIAARDAAFPPPVDIVVPQGTTLPRRPYYLLYSPLPYVSRTGSGQLSKLVPGDAVLGGKVRLLAPGGRRPGLAAVFELKLPMTRALSSLQSGAGTGGYDETLGVTAEWRTRRGSLVASSAFTHVGQPAFGDQLIALQPDGRASRTDMPLCLASRLELGIGYRHVLRPSVALVAELTKNAAVGGHTPAYEAAGPLDVLAGSQIRWHGLHVTLGVRYHANSIPELSTYSSPFAGMADLTSVAPKDRDAYLRAIGAGPAASYIRDRAQIAVVMPLKGPPLPRGAHVLPPYYMVRSHDRIGSMLVVGWRFGRRPARREARAR